MRQVGAISDAKDKARAESPAARDEVRCEQGGICRVELRCVISRAAVRTAARNTSVLENPMAVGQ